MKLYLSGNMSDSYWVYAISTVRLTGEKELKFMWCDKMTDIVNFKTLKKCFDYDPNLTYEIEFLARTNNRIEGDNKLNNLIRLNGKTPPYNLRMVTYGNRMRILCIDTGVIYQNAQEIIRQLGLNQSVLSNHLNRRPGYRTVKGYRFIYTDAPYNITNIPGTFPLFEQHLPKVYHYDNR